MKYYIEEWCIGGLDKVGPPFDDTVFSSIKKALDRIQQLSNEMDFITVIEYNLQSFVAVKLSKDKRGIPDFAILNCCFSNLLNSFYSWKCYHNHEYDFFTMVHSEKKTEHIIYQFGDRLRNYVAHNAFAITCCKYDVINEKYYCLIDPNQLLSGEKWNADLKSWLQTQSSEPYSIDAHDFAVDFYQVCLEVQNILWSKQTQQLLADFALISQYFPRGYTNIYNMNMVSEDKCVHVGIGQIIACLLMKAAHQYPEFIPTSFLGRF